MYRFGYGAKFLVADTQDSVQPRPLQFALIHLTSGKYGILGSPYSRSCIAEGPIGPETPDSPGPVPNPKPYILGC